jgi:hypothetical protein
MKSDAVRYIGQAQVAKRLQGVTFHSSHDDAAILLAKAKAGFRRGTDACADVCGEAFALQALGIVRRNQGRLDEAATFLGQALKSFQALRCAYGQACVLFSLGTCRACTGLM